MQIHIHTGDGVPIYRQIFRQVRHMIAADRLKAGDELPAIRQLADQLVINPNTVARAYRELESSGLVVSRQGSGTRVAEGDSPLNQREKMKILNERTDALLVEADQLGVAFSDVQHLLETRHRELRREPREKD